MTVETRVMSGHEQLSVVLRVINHEVGNNDQKQQSPLFNEYFLGCIKLDKGGGGAISDEIGLLEKFDFFYVNFHTHKVFESDHQWK